MFSRSSTLLLVCWLSWGWRLGTSLLAEEVLNALSIQNGTRYENCPFHATNSRSFACFMEDTSRVTRIFRHTFSSAATYINARQVFGSTQLRGKTILFVGDSLARNQFRSLACLLWEADETIKTQDVRTGGIRSIHSRKYNVEIKYVQTW